jgi:hypothetical protein
MPHPLVGFCEQAHFGLNDSSEGGEGVGGYDVHPCSDGSLHKGAISPVAYDIFLMI